MLHELMGWDWLFVSMPYGEPWRDRRRLFLQHFRNVALYRPPQVKFVGRALVQLLDNPENFFKIIEDMAGGMSISLAYGLNVKDNNDPFVDLALRAFQTGLDSSFPGAFLVDVIPWLKYVPEWVPGARFKKTAKGWRKLQNDFHELPLLRTAYPSLTSLSMAQLGDSVDNEQLSVIKDSAGMLYGGATDTTVSSMTMFIVAMLSYPEVQKRAHDELDRVLEGRMPDFGDEQNLPYISAVHKEVLSGFPHQLTEDDVYEGYHIPKGSVVMANSWAMLHNEDDYPDPSSFKPERFLTKDGKLNPTVRDPGLMAFGFGRRICPGAQLARSILWLWIVSFLTNFEVSSPLDENGEPFEPSIEYQANSVTFHPHPFKCTIKPRSKASEEMVRGFTDV
ncbi:cytochrome P450 [Gymnopilus junonius]|uniref:Cytochrome P450 n=1 Tax=Gymnopilus junonius TaxID=109634 RepID=A0A9P5NZ42_GYMJU|nr:cytochrome P450 [Gymnopilus junonius]